MPSESRSCSLSTLDAESLRGTASSLNGLVKIISKLIAEKTILLVLSLNEESHKLFPVLDGKLLIFIQCYSIKNK